MIQSMCELANVSRAGFYRDWQERAPAEAEVVLRDSVQRAALAHRRYGYRRITVVVQRSGVEVSERVVRRILRSDNLLAVRKRKFKVLTDSQHNFTVYANIAQYLVVDRINQLWVADLTYVRLRQEFVYLAVVLDVYSRRAVGWALGRNLQTTLPLRALDQAIQERRPCPGLVHHSDRGSQYASNDYVKRLEKAGMLISMSRPARPWENAYCESFLHTLKAEQINHLTCATLEELEQSIGAYIHEFYNVKRLHSALGYRSPEEFERTQPNQHSTPLTLSFLRHQEIYPDV
jgi:transposase InsO family protein